MGLVRLTRCTVIDAFCRQTRDVEDPGPRDLDGGILVGRPVHGVTHQQPMIGAEQLPEDAIDVPGEIDDATRRRTLAE